MLRPLRVRCVTLDTELHWADASGRGPNDLFLWGKTNVAFLTRSVAVWLGLACLLGVCGFAWAESSFLRGARVIWVRGDRVYVASPDSLTLEPGTILAFKNRGKQVATGEVTAVHDGELIAAKLTSGSLADRKSTRLNSSHRCISYAVFCL